MVRTEMPEVAGLSPEEVRLLHEAARATLPHAYAPYSNFPVAAAVLAEPAHVHVGVNVENAAYPLGTCAERSAVCAAISAGHRQLRAILILSAADDAAFPCGSCRQVMNEFAPGLPVILVGAGGRLEVHGLDALLPHAFGPEDLAEAAVEVS